MSKSLVGWAVQEAPKMYPDLSSGACHLLVVLADFYSDSEKQAWPSLNTLTTVMHCSKQSVLRYMNELLAAGLVTKRRRPNQSNTYWIRRINPVERALKVVPNWNTVVPNLDMGSTKLEHLDVSNWNPNTYEPLDNIPPFELEDEPVPYWQLEHEPLTEQTHSVIEELKAKLQ